MRCLLLASLTILLGACASAPEPTAPPPTEAEIATAETAAPVPERSIPADALYPLLLAEFALHRQQFDVALQEYMTQAELLRDPGLSKYVTHVAGSLNREAEARAAAGLWADLAPDDSDANMILANLLARNGDTPQALHHFSKALAQGEEVRFPVLLNQFEQLSPEGQSQLRRGLEAELEKHPDNSSLLLTLALLYDEQDLPEQANAMLERLFEQEPDQYQGVILEAKLRVEAGHPQPFAHIEQALESDPENSKLRLQYARLLAREDIEAARKQFEILSSQSPRNGNLLFSLALINHETGDNITAKAYLHQMIELGQRTDEAHYYLGLIAEEDQQVQDAVRAYLAVSDPGSRHFYPAKGRASRLMLENEQPEASYAMFNELRREAPDASSQLYSLEADILANADYPLAAMQLLDQALSEDDSDAVRYARAMLAERQGNVALMESDLRTIIRRTPDNATALNALGYSLSNHTNRYDEALELVEQALALEPDDPAILDSMGWALYRLGRSEEALPYLEQAYLRFPDPEVAAHLGEVLWALGRQDDARVIWGRALQGNSEHKILTSTIQRFDSDLLSGSP